LSVETRRLRAHQPQGRPAARQVHQVPRPAPTMTLSWRARTPTRALLARPRPHNPALRAAGPRVDRRRPLAVGYHRPGIFAVEHVDEEGRVWRRYPHCRAGSTCWRRSPASSGGGDRPGRRHAGTRVRRRQDGIELGRVRALARESGQWRGAAWSAAAAPDRAFSPTWLPSPCCAATRTWPPSTPNCAQGKPAKVALTTITLVLANALLKQDRLWACRAEPALGRRQPTPAAPL